MGKLEKDTTGTILMVPVVPVACYQNQQVLQEQIHCFYPVWYNQHSDAFTDLWYIVVSPLSLFLLQFDGDSSDRTPLNPLHQMCYIPTSGATHTKLSSHGTAMIIP